MRTKLKNRLIIGVCVLLILLLEPFSALVSNLVSDDENLVKIEYLTRENENLKNDLRIMEEINELKSKDSNLIIARVIERNIYSFYDELIIDKGSKEGINEGDSVISKDGFLGVVKKVREEDSIISLISNKNLNISVKVNDVYGSFNRGKVKNITNQGVIEIGDKVYTSGLTNIKGGLYIGKVVKTYLDKQEIEQSLEVELASRVEEINYVGVVK